MPVKKQPKPATLLQRMIVRRYETNINYISMSDFGEKMKEHHHRITFKKELIRLLKKTESITI